MNTSRTNANAYGPQTAGNVVMGSEGTPAGSNKYETYDGTSYSNGPTTNQARFAPGACGTSTAGLAFGGYSDPGYTGGANLSEEYNGSAWAEGNNLNTGRYDVAGFGIQTAAVAVGGADAPAALSNVEHYDGTSWTNATALANPQRNMGACGVQTAGLIFAGNLNTGGGESKTGLTQGYDGTTWSTRPSMATSRIQIAPAHAGSSTSTFAAGGNVTNPVTNATEEFTGETTSANIADFTTS